MQNGTVQENGSLDQHARRADADGNNWQGNGHNERMTELEPRVQPGPRFDPRAGSDSERSGRRWFRSGQHDAAIAAIHRLIEANKEARRTMQADERVLERTLRSLEAGHGIAGTFARVPTEAARRTSNDAERALLRARHQLRLTVFAAGLVEGMSIAELRAVLGFLAPARRAAT